MGLSYVGVRNSLQLEAGIWQPCCYVHLTDHKIEHNREIQLLAQIRSHRLDVRMVFQGCFLCMSASVTMSWPFDFFPTSKQVLWHILCLWLVIDIVFLHYVLKDVSITVSEFASDFFLDLSSSHGSHPPCSSPLVVHFHTYCLHHLFLFWMLFSFSGFLFGSATWQAWCCSSEESSAFRTSQTRSDSPGWLFDVSVLTGCLGSVVLLCFVR